MSPPYRVALSIRLKLYVSNALAASATPSLAAPDPHQASVEEGARLELIMEPESTSVRDDPSSHPWAESSSCMSLQSCRTSRV
ncbi:hypothetical protein EVAR_77142_1 [Eumeta japonica]|uniref:Uncharacterized protein n=1 Tax=Eumeta variegata TaxID=151549 RepID=A0A4C1T1Z3_EUMVA|nr:hypothetical protein EVAR_77142_1 [Eumeta japonica]